MYAIIRAGGKQQKVAPGDVIEVERLKGEQSKVEFTPIMVVDDDGKVNTGSSALGKAKVTAEVLGESKSEKIQVLKFRNKTGYRRRAGHRQRYSTLQISDIALDGASKSTSKSSAKKSTAKKTSAKKSTAKTSSSKTSASKTSEDEE